MNAKVIFIDVDGTLVNYENELPDSAVEAIRKARANGHKVYICTGRSEAEIYDNIWNIGLDGMIGGNGSFVKSADTVVMWQHITLEQCKHIVDWLHSRSLEFYLESNSGLYASEKFEEVGTPVIKEYSGRKGKDTTNLTIGDVFPDMIWNAPSLYRDDLNKVSYVLNSYQDYLDSKKEFPDLKAGTWGGSGEKALFGDLGVKGIDKGHAIDVLLAYLGMDIEDTLAFGDASVDIPMLQKCKIGIAMASGGEEVKKVADYVTDAVDDNGIYNAFKKFGLI